MQSWLHDHETEIYSTNNVRKFVVDGRFVGTLKNEVYNNMAAISKNVYIDKLDDMFDKYDNANHRKIKIMFINVKTSTYIDLSNENNNDNYGN